MLRIGIAFLVSLLLFSSTAYAWLHGGSSHNGGLAQVHVGQGPSDGNYPFTNLMKGMATPNSYGDNSGVATPAEVDANGYLLHGSNAETNHGGLYNTIYLPAVVDGGASYYVYRVTGKGTILNNFQTIASSTTTSVTTGATTTLNFGAGAGPFSGGTHDFRAGMEVPIAGNNGTISPNLTTGGANGAYTVCAAGLTATSIRLCLADGVTDLSTTGAAGGNLTVSYGRRAVGVATGGRVIISTSGLQYVSVGIAAQDATTPITDMAFVAQGSEEVRYESGCLDCIFGAKFLASLRGSNFGVIRNLGPINGNDGLDVRWADRRPQSYVTWAGFAFDRSPSVWVSSTTNSGNDYSATVGSGAPTDRQQLILKFNASSTTSAASVTITSGSKTMSWTSNGLSVGNPVSCDTNTAATVSGVSNPVYPQANLWVTTAATNSIEVSFTPGGTAITWGANSTISCLRQPTFNLNGTGAVPIRDYYGSGIIANSSNRQIDSTKIGTLTYDAVLGAWLKEGADANGNFYFTGGWPPEVFLRLCIVLGAHPWFTSPRYVFDGTTGLTDYIPSLAAYVAANQPSWMKPRYEVWPNELWNSQFAATSLGTGYGNVYANTVVSNAAGWSTSNPLGDWAGKVGSVAGQAINQAYGNIAVDGARYQTVGGVQTGVFLGVSGSGASNYNRRLQSTSYVSQTTSPQSGYAKSAASNWVTHIALANYVAPGLYTKSSETTLASAFDGGYISSGSISGNSLTATVSVGTSPIPAGTIITGPGVPAGTAVVSGSGPYTLNNTLTTSVSGVDMTTVNPSGDQTAPTTYIDTFNYNATFTASISGTVMTVSAVSSGTIFTGDYVTVGATTGTKISSLGTGAGGTGTYNLDTSQTVASTTMKTSGQYSNPATKLGYDNVALWVGGFTTKDGTTLKCTAYEGGYSPDYTGAGRNQLDQLKLAGKYVPGIKTYMAQTFADFKNAGCEFPSLLNHTGRSPSNNVWSVLEDVYQTPGPIWEAYREYN